MYYAGRDISSNGRGRNTSLLSNWADSGNIRFAWGSLSFCTGHGIRFLKTKALDLSFKLLPGMTQSLERDAVPALQMRPEFLIAQEASKNALHTRLLMLPPHEAFGNRY